MKFIVLASLFVLSVVAEPEAQHLSMGYVKHFNGAVTPDDTDSVKMAKAVHANAHVTAAVNGYKAPLVYASPMYKAVAPVTYVAPKVQKVEVQAPKVVSYAAPKVVAPVTYTHPVAHSVAPVTYTHATPYVYGHHALFKREAEAEADPQVFYNTYGYYPTATTYAASAYGAWPYTTYNNYMTYASAPVTTAYTTPYVATHAVYKREAEAEAKPEADAQFVYNTPVVYNSAYNTYPYASAYTYPYASTYAAAPVTTAYTYPYAYNTAYQRVFKREAESEADAQYFYNAGYYGYPRYTYGAYPYNYYGYPNVYRYGGYAF